MIHDELQRYESESPMHLKGFWRGCLITRQQMLQKADSEYETQQHSEAIQRIERILASLEQGIPLQEIPEYYRWLAHAAATRAYDIGTLEQSVDEYSPGFIVRN